MNTSRIYVMRHGEAGFDAASDFERRLTSRGEQALDRMLARERALLSDVAAVLPSPYLRARQTAERVSRYLAVPLLEPDDALVPDASVPAVLAVLESCAWNGLLLVSHQPLLGKLVATLVDGDARSPEPMEPGALVRVELEWPAAGLGSRLVKIEP